jgi:ABC-type nitrate/sulfonate/bicarbonate transport system permease component
MSVAVENSNDAVYAEKDRARVPNWVITVISVLCAIGVWEYFGRDIDPLFGSYPSAIFAAFLEMMGSNQLPEAFIASLQPFVVGLVISAIVGVPIGLLLGRYRIFEAAFGIYVTAGYATPLIAMVPVLILWFGLGFEVKVVIVVLMSFFPICINTWLGVKAVPNTLIEVGRAFVASDFEIMLRIVLPAVLPYIMAGIRLAIGKAVIAMIIAEFLTAISGLGGLIINSAQSFQTAEMFVPIILVMILAVGLTAFVGWLEKKIAPWQSEIAGDNEM